MCDTKSASHMISKFCILWWLHAAFWKSILTNTAQKLIFSITDFFSKCDQIAVSCGFGHIYCRNPWWKFSFFVQCKIYIWPCFILWNIYFKLLSKESRSKTLVALHCLLQIFNFLLSSWYHPIYKYWTNSAFKSQFQHLVYMDQKTTKWTILIIQISELTNWSSFLIFMKFHRELSQ